ncbi:MAG: hypothetical protein ACSHYA_12005 [Opitutaceae bacterium]
MDKKPITQKDIALRLGLDHSTVSLALRNSNKISKERCLLIQKTAAEMGYSVNAAAANLAKHRFASSKAPVTAALGWLNCWPDPRRLHTLQEFELYWKFAKETAARFGYHLEEFIVEGEMTLERTQRIMQTRGIRGILIPPHPETGINFESFDWSQFSALRFGRSVKCPAAHTVAADQVGNMVRAFKEVVNRGYKRIGMVDVSAHLDRYNFDAGYLKAQAISSGLACLPIFRINVGDKSKNQANFNLWLKRERPDAVIAATGGVTGLLEGAGVTIGEGIGLAAMSILDTRIDAGIYQNSEEIGRVAALSLIAQIQDNDIGVPDIYRQTLVPGTWVNGKSLPDRRA